MYELQKTLCLLVLSAPLLYGVNHLAHRVSSYPDPQVFNVNTKAMDTQAYYKGTY
jgi:hypothetical protein